VTAVAPVPFARRDASRGVYWLREAYARLSAHRLPWLLLLMLYYLLLGLVDLVPLVGGIAAPLLKPVFAVGFLAAAWTQERGGAPELKLLFRGFSANVLVLLAIGVVFVGGVGLALLSTSLVDGGKTLDLLSGKLKPDEATFATGEVQLAMLFAAVCATPVVLAIWFAPALVVFQGCGPVRALATSLRCCLVNWRPVGVYGLMLFFYGGVVPGIVTGLIALVAPRDLAFTVALLLLMPYFFLFVATLHISDYVSYRDLFHADESTEDTVVATGGDRVD
jgi:hypothetical protein